jgi:hypothetical protein
MLEMVVEAAGTAHARQQRRERLVEAQLARQTVPLADLALDDARDVPEEAELAKEPVEEALVRTRLEGMGYRVGWCLAER